MSTEQQSELQQLLDLVRPHAHPNFQGVSLDGRRVRCEFKPFTGREPEPEIPQAYWDTTLPEGVRSLMGLIHDEATRLWDIARYIHELQVATDGAAPRWTAYTAARDAMNQAYEALGQPDAHQQWRSLVFQLTQAQDAALAAARDWDALARRIAQVDDRRVYADIAPRDAQRQAGIDQDWDIRSLYDYQGGYEPQALAYDVGNTIREQRDHVRTVADLTGDPTS